MRPMALFFECLASRYTSLSKSMLSTIDGMLDPPLPFPIRDCCQQHLSRWWAASGHTLNRDQKSQQAKKTSSQKQALLKRCRFYNIRVDHKTYRVRL